MGHDREINQVNIIQTALTNHKGFTSGEKTYFMDNLVDWVKQDKTLELLISKFSEKSLDAKPLLKDTGLLA